MVRTKLSKNFYLDEFTRSQTATRFDIDNDVEFASSQFLALNELVRHVLQPVRDNLGPVSVTSGYRGRILNLKIGGSMNSQHMLGEAADFVVSGHSPFDVSQWIEKNLNYEFDQLINEFGNWVHVSRTQDDRDQRRSVLTASRKDGGTKYQNGLFNV